MLFAAGALTLGFTACEEDGQDLNFNIQPGNELYAPAANASVNLDQGLNTSFEWAPSVAEDGGYITYEVLFDKDYYAAVDDYNHAIITGIVKIAAKTGILIINNRNG